MTICGITKNRGVNPNPIASPRGVAVSEIYKQKNLDDFPNYKIDEEEFKKVQQTFD